MSEQRRIVLGVTGASGAIYAVRLLQVLVQTDAEVHLTISPSGAAVIQQELGLTIDPTAPNLATLLNFRPAWGTSESIDQLITAAADGIGRVAFPSIRRFSDSDCFGFLFDSTQW